MMSLYHSETPRKEADYGIIKMKGAILPSLR